MTESSPSISETLSSDNESRFTLRTSNAMLPLVRSITADIVELTVEITQTRHRLDDLGIEYETDLEDDVYSSELTAIRASTERQSDRVKECVTELSELGVWPRSLISGYVDFPAIREGKDVCLCWRLGEPEVMYWHGADEPCSCRRLADLSLIRQSGNLPQLTGSV